MLEHQKKVLEGVSNNNKLFRNELIKSITWLNKEELLKLKDWAELRFGDIHHDLIADILQLQKESA